MLYDKKKKTGGGVRRRGSNSALIWLDLAKIPNRDWSAVLVVSEQLTLSLYHGNNLLLKPRKQINYGKDISRCHYGVIRKKHFHAVCKPAGQAEGGSVFICVMCVCLCACVCTFHRVSLLFSWCLKCTADARMSVCLCFSLILFLNQLFFSDLCSWNCSLWGWVQFCVCMFLCATVETQDDFAGAE